MNVEEGVRVLIVDDDPHVLRAYSRLLRKAGYHVIEASTGGECLRLAQENKPDLILLDVVLPDVDGVEVCRRVKADPALSGTFVVLLSGLRTASDEQVQGLEGGADGYITRPIPDRELLARVRSFARIKALESQLRIQYEWLRVTLSSAGDGIISTDDEGRVEFVNPVAESMTGWEEREARKKPIEDVFTIVDGDTSEPLENPVRQVIRGRGTVRLDPRASLVARDGRRVPIADSAAPITDGEGEMVGVVLLFQDVTERVRTEAIRARAEEALQASEELLRRVIDASPNCIFVKDQDGEYLLVNRAIAEIYGTTPEEMVGKTDLEFADMLRLSPEDAEQFVADDREVIVSQQAKFVPEEPLTLPDGTTKWFQTVKVPLAWRGAPDRGNALQLCMLGVAMDITQRKEAEAALRESEDRFRNLVTRSHDLVCSHDLEGRILSVNPAAAALLGYDRSVLLEMNLRNVLAPEVRGEFDAYLEGIRENGVASGLMRVQTNAGERRIWEYDNVLRTEGVAEPVVRAMAHDVTGRVRAQQALKESEARLAEAQRMGRLGNWEWDAVNDEVFWSDEIYRIFGLSPEDFEPAFDRHLEFIPPEDIPEYQRMIEKAMAGGGTFEYEHRVLRPDGEVRTVWVRGGVRVDEAGKPTGMWGTTQDITERKQAEEAVRRYVERLRALRAIDGAILAAWSPEEIAQAALRRVRQLVPCRGAGILTFDSVVQEATLFVMDAADDVSVQPGLCLPIGGSVELEALQQGKVLVERDLTGAGEDSQLPPATQTIRDVGVRSYVAVPLIVGGKLIGVVALASDRAGAFVLEHVDVIREVADQLAVALHHGQLREALEIQERRLAALVEHLPEGVLWLDSDHRILLLNPAGEDCLLDLTDVSVGDVLTHLGGRPVEELLKHPAEGAWHELTIEGPPRRVFEVVARPVTGGEVGADRGQSGQVLLIRDVTAEREAQEQSHQQERLAAVGQLAGGIAHDFNNMLTTIILQAEMALGKPHVLPDQVRAFQTVAEEARKAANLVRQILDFSRRSPIEREPVDLGPFVEETVRILERTIPENIAFRLEMGSEEYAAPLTVYADPTRIQQVLMNLVVNARDAMPEGGELQIGLSRVAVGPGEEPPLSEMTPGEWVCLSVSDTGVGIPPDVLPHVFEPFFTTKEVGEGTGLGLAQVYGIVTQHEGYIGVETEVRADYGQSGGTTFRVYLPAYEREEEEALQEEAALPIPEGLGETILLVEDQERIRLAGQQVLESLGYRVLTAADGREGLAVYRAAERVDLVITDVVMPEMGGREMVREMRKMTPDLRALAITGYILREDLEDLKAEGFLDVIHKPFDVETLAQLIRRALD